MGGFKKLRYKKNVLNYLKCRMVIVIAISNVSIQIASYKPEKEECIFFFNISGINIFAQSPVKI